MWQYPQTDVVQKEAEKNLKYKSLCIEMQRMWNMKCTIEPVIIGATGIVTRSLKKKIWKLYRENIRKIHYKRQLYSEQHTQYGMYCSVKLEA